MHMRFLRSGLAALVLVTIASGAPPVRADDRPRAHPPSINPPPGMEDVVPMMEEATRSLMEILEMFLRRIPIYEMPEVLDNGDIIIRRKKPPPPPAKPPLPGDADPDHTRT